MFGQYAILLNSETMSLESQILGPGLTASYPIGAIPAMYDALCVLIWPAAQSDASFGSHELMLWLIVWMPIVYNAFRAFVPTLSSNAYALFDAALVFDCALSYLGTSLLCADVHAPLTFGLLVVASAGSKAALAITKRA